MCCILDYFLLKFLYALFINNFFPPINKLAIEVKNSHSHLTISHPTNEEKHVRLRMILQMKEKRQGSSFESTANCVQRIMDENPKLLQKRVRLNLGHSQVLIHISNGESYYVFNGLKILIC